MANHSDVDLDSGYDIADEYAKLEERLIQMYPEEQVPPNQPDCNVTPYIECTDKEGKIHKLSFSYKGYLLLPNGIEQINTKSPIGQFVMNNWDNLKPGSILEPCGFIITFIGRYNPLIPR